MAKTTHPSAHPILADTDSVVTKFRSSFAVRDPVTGQTLHFRDETRATAYACLRDIATACAEA